MISDRDLTGALEGDVVRLLDRHLEKAKEWFPHEFRNPIEPWAPQGGDDQALRSALYVNLLTEDNLPAYTSEIDRWFGSEGPWGAWARRWTAEEGRHSIALREWIHATGVLDPYELERARMATVQHGLDTHGIPAAHAIVYVTIQELATRTAHANTGRLITDDTGARLMQRIAIDENLHFLFYRDLVQAFLRQAPSEGVIAIDAVVRSFHMPGVGLPAFRQHARVIADAGIYSWPVHVEDVLAPILRFWAIDEVAGLTPAADRARDRLFGYVSRLRRLAHRVRSFDAASSAVS